MTCSQSWLIVYVCLENVSFDQKLFSSARADCEKFRGEGFDWVLRLRAFQIVHLEPSQVDHERADDGGVLIVSYLLTGLSPYTRYTVQVASWPGVGGYWSDLSFTQAVTEQDGK